MKAALAFTLPFVACLLVLDTIAAIDPSTLPNTTYMLYHGWDDGHDFYHYTFNITSVVMPVTVAPTVRIYKLLLNASDDVHNTTQASIIDLIPGDAGYSDLWQVVKVVVPPGLPVIKSYAALDKYVANRTARVYPTDTYVNCPVVGPGSSLQNPSDAPHVTGYYRGYNVSWFDFGPNPAGNATAPLYHVMTKDGIVELTDSRPGDANYSAFWNIYTVEPSAANANAGVKYTSFSQTSADNITFAGLLVNCPIVSSTPNSTATTPVITAPPNSAAGVVPSVVLSVVAMVCVSVLL